MRLGMQGTIGAVMLVLLAGAAGCSNGHESAGGHKEGTAREQAAPVTVRTAVVGLSEWPRTYEAVGTVKARTSGQVSSRVMAYVREVKVAAGQRVTAGQTLIVLDARDFEVRQRQAEAARAEMNTATAEADHAIEAAKANVELAETTFRRIKDLFDKKSVSQQEFDEAAARVRVARASLNMAQAKRSQIDSKIAQVTEEVAAAGVQKGYSVLSAPFGGVVVARNVEPGNLAVPGAPLLVIEQESGYRFEATVEESQSGKVKLGQAATVRLDAGGEPLIGRVSEIVPAVDPVSRAFIAKIDLPASSLLRSGMFGRAAFASGSQQVLAVPDAALTERGQTQWAFVVDGGVARARIVTTGQRQGGAVEILSGLVSGEKIVAPVPSGLNDGARVEVRQ